MNYSINFSTQILYAGKCNAGREWKYKNIISPFSRMYIFSGGKGIVYMNKTRYVLSSGDLFIIPRFTSHTYECDDFTEHSYVCFFDEMIGMQSLFDLEKIQYQLKATDLDLKLMSRLIKLNESKKLPALDPHRYDNRKEILPFNNSLLKESISEKMESVGILLQLLSRFFKEDISNIMYPKVGTTHRISKVLNYINNNLDKSLSLTVLSGIVCMSHDHFTRVFKKIMGISPNRYIQLKRVERAQTLLLTTYYSIQEVAQIVGISNVSQFSTLFKKITQYSPQKYIKMHREIM